ncbi:MAG TPA: hypothetical protein VK158_03130 [Acidobacteriota bacterium]|nr:hypothetical protein [Acidobacteriota bacterium]
MALADKYSRVKTAQDLIDMGVVPKTSSEYLALITVERLKKARDEARSQLSPDMLGQWIPAVKAETVKASELKEAADKYDYLTSLSKSDKTTAAVRVVGPYKKWDLENMVGRVYEYGDSPKKSGSSGIVVEYDDPVKKLDGQVDESTKVGNKYRVTVPWNHVEFTSDDQVPVAYDLHPGVVAKPDLGHLIRVTEAIEVSEGREKKKIKANTTGRIVEYDKDKGIIAIAVKPKRGSETMYTLPIDEAHGVLQVSSHGQEEPADIEEVVREEAFARVFPKTKVETAFANDVATGILMNKDMVFYGPAGGGKTTICEDLAAIAQQREIQFVAEGSQCQTSPFSLIDPSFARKVIPCAETMIAHDNTGKYRATGIFKPKHPSKINVDVKAFGPGFGVELLNGTPGVRQFNLVGYKMPTDANAKSNGYDPEGVQYGALVRTNNGVLIIDEAHLIPDAEKDTLRFALSNNRVKIDQIRFENPAHAAIFKNANEVDCFTAPIKDRVLFFPMHYPQDVDVSHKITRASIHGLREEPSAVEIPDVHIMQPIDIVKTVSMPSLLERSIDALYIKMREIRSEDSTSIILGNRSKLDALYAARSQLFIDRLFYEKRPHIVTMPYATNGVLFATRSRLACDDRAAEIANYEAIEKLVTGQIESVFTQEADVWWCNQFKDIASKESVSAGIAKRFETQLQKTYADVTELVRPFEELQAAVKNQNARETHILKKEYPLAGMFFDTEANFHQLSIAQLKETAQFYMDAMQHSKCKIPLKG